MDAERVDPTVLRESRAWRESMGRPVTPLDYLASQVSIGQVLAVGRLFWPSFLEVQGCVLLADRHSEDQFRQWWEQLEGEVTEVERVLNHLHLWDLFDGDDEVLRDEALSEIAELIASSWRCALAHAYPNRAFKVVVSTDAHDYGPTVTMWSG